MINIETMIDLKKAINNTLKDSFPLIKIHSNDVKEGFAKPCFFNQIIPINMDYETTNFTSHKMMVVINYFSEEDKEREKYKMDGALKMCFGMTLKVNKRSFLIQNARSEIIDGVLQFRFDLDYFDGMEREDLHELIGEVDLEMKRSEE